MDIYKRMYCRLFNRITDVLKTDVDDITRKKLILAQQETEEMFMSYCPIVQFQSENSTDRKE